MKIKFDNPIKFSVTAVFAIFIAYIISIFILAIFFRNLSLPYYVAPIAERYTLAVLRVIFSIPAIIFMGVVLKENGFKFAFSLKNSKQALFACSALILWMLTPTLHLFNMSGVDEGFFTMILPIIAFQASSGIYEEVLFRGLFMTAILIKYSDTIKRRLLSVIISAVVFGLVHVDAGLFNVIGTALIGMGLGAVYLYSGNLIVLMIVHALWNILIQISNGLIVSVHNEFFLRVVQFMQPIILFAIIPAFAIFITIKAKPFPETLSKFFKTKEVEM